MSGLDNMHDVVGDPTVVVAGEYEESRRIAAAPARRKTRFGLVKAASRLWRTRIGGVLTVAIVAIAVLGPLLAPHSSTAFVGAPYSPPSGALPLGADGLGRDVLSRVLDGGLSILVVSAVATVLGVGLGTVLGLIAGYMQGIWDEIIMRAGDVLLCFPPIVFSLLLMSVLGTKTWLIVVAVMFSHAPRTARVMRGATQQLIGSDFITYAEALGMSKRRILRREILANVATPLTVEGGLRMTYSIVVVASLDYLGFGAQPPAANWGLMINENHGGLTIQPWAVVVPVILIALLTIGNNLIADGVGRAAAGIDRQLDWGAE